MFIEKKYSPLISIISVVLNNRQGLAKTISSIKEQIFQDYELLIIDGASIDGTAEEAFKEAQPPKIRVISEPDKGIFDAMNKGLDQASGRFVVFLNTGDTFVDKNTLACIEPFLLRDDIDLLYGGCIKSIAGKNVNIPANNHTSIIYGMFGVHQTMYFRLSVIGPMRYDSRLRVCGDYDFTARFLKKSKKIVNISKSLCIFERPNTSFRLWMTGLDENWEIQRDVLSVPLMQRIFFRIVSLVMRYTYFYCPGIYRFFLSRNFKNFFWFFWSRIW